jgi:hypothetical protein
LTRHKKMNWIGGKHIGNHKFKLKYGKYQSRIMNDNKAYSKSFEKESDAIAWLKDKSEEFGMTKNKYRISQDKTYLEVQLTQGKILLCDIEDLEIVNSVYLSVKVGKHTSYCRASIKNCKSAFHRLIKPWNEENEWEHVDHINRNGLDNRRANLRDGSGTINANNQSLRSDNVSNKTGVHYSNYDRCWIVQWPENGKRKTKSFRVCDNSGTKKEGNNHTLTRTFEEAKELAIKFRKEKDEELDLRNGYSA